VEKRDEYMTSLKTASINGNITAFDKFMYGLVGLFETDLG